MTSFMFSFLNTFYCDTNPEKFIYKARLTFKCQTCLGYTTENKPLSGQKTMCVDWLNATQTVHIAAFTFNHRQHSTPHKPSALQQVLPEMNSAAAERKVIINSHCTACRRMIQRTAQSVLSWNKLFKEPDWLKISCDFNAE